MTPVRTDRLHRTTEPAACSVALGDVHADLIPGVHHGFSLNACCTVPLGCMHRRASRKDGKGCRLAQLSVAHGVIPDPAGLLPGVTAERRGQKIECAIWY